MLTPNNKTFYRLNHNNDIKNESNKNKLFNLENLVNKIGNYVSNSDFFDMPNWKQIGNTLFYSTFLAFCSYVTIHALTPEKYLSGRIHVKTGETLKDYYEGENAKELGVSFDKYYKEFQRIQTEALDEDIIDINTYNQNMKNPNTVVKNTRIILPDINEDGKLGTKDNLRCPYNYNLR